MKGNTLKIAYIQGRPSAHPLHKKLAECVGADFHYVDFKMRWQDKKRSILYRLCSWLLCAITFPSKKKYVIFLVDNLHFMPVFMKRLRLIGRKQKIVAHMGSHTLYFLYSHRFSRSTERMHLWALKHYDAIICEGKMAEELVQALLGSESPKTYPSFLGVPGERTQSLAQVKPNLDSYVITTIAQVTGIEFRAWYKGLDLMIQAFEKAHLKDNRLSFYIVGQCDEEVKENLLLNIDKEAARNIFFVGHTTEIEKYLSISALYLHTARGDAFPTSTLEALKAGLPVMVSDFTGTKEIVEKISPSLVVPLDDTRIAGAIVSYFDLSASEKKRLSDKSREIVEYYTEENAIARYREIIHAIGKQENK